MHRLVLSSPAAPRYYDVDIFGPWFRLLKKPDYAIKIFQPCVVPTSLAGGHRNIDHSENIINVWRISLAALKALHSMMAGSTEAITRFPDIAS